jgi:hypothetical protein
MRASEAEREEAVEELRRHAEAGRLDMDELEQRVEAAFAARTREELAELRADLPAAPRPRQRDGDFTGHLRAFVAVQLMLVGIWALTGFGYFWPVWPFMGWGIGLVVHGLCDSGTEAVWALGSRKARRRKGIASSPSC